VQAEAKPTGRIRQRHDAARRDQQAGQHQRILALAQGRLFDEAGKGRLVEPDAVALRRVTAQRAADMRAQNLGRRGRRPSACAAG